MPSVLSDYLKKEKILKQLQDELQQLESNSELKKELEFKEKLHSLMSEYGKVAREVCEILEPSSLKAPAKAASVGGRKKQLLKIYKNPHTGEVVETRGGNNKAIQEWKAEYGHEEVVQWVVEKRG